MSSDLTHLDATGHPHMVDVGDKSETDREATAEGWVLLSPGAYDAVVHGRVKKGDVFLVAELAGIQGAKRTSDLIPLCHPLPIDGVDVSVTPVEGRLRVVARVRTRGRTGVEMEAMTAVTAAALTVYDLVKAIDRGVRIDGVRLLKKSGGRSGTWTAEGA